MTIGPSSAPRARIVALSPRDPPDGSVGRAVLEAVRRRGLPEGVELCVASDASELLALLRLDGPVVLVDALMGGVAGEVRAIRPGDLDSAGRAAASTRGLSVGGALALARFLAPGETSKAVTLVGVATGSVGRADAVLSPAILDAVECAAELALALASGGESRRDGDGDDSRC